jgi:hypothetical protein
VVELMIEVIAVFDFDFMLGFMVAVRDGEFANELEGEPGGVSMVGSIYDAMVNEVNRWRSRSWSWEKSILEGGVEWR